MDYSYRLPRLFNDVEELREHQKKLERYLKFLQDKKKEDAETLEKKIADQEKQIEKLKERTELLAKDNLRLKEDIKKLLEEVEFLMDREQRDERLQVL